MVEQLVTKILDKAIATIRQINKDSHPPQFLAVELGGIPPEVIATSTPAENLLTGQIDIDNSISNYLEADARNGWVGECRVRFLLLNKTSQPLRVVGINPNKMSCELRPVSAVLFPSQGAPVGDAVRFECDLDKDQPSMKRFDLVDHARRYRSEEYYFDEGFIEIGPGSQMFFSLIFKAKEFAYCIHPSIVYRIKGTVDTLTIPLEREVYIFPVKNFDQKELFRRSFSVDPPYIVRDESAYRFLFDA